MVSVTLRLCDSAVRLQQSLALVPFYYAIYIITAETRRRREKI